MKEEEKNHETTGKKTTLTDKIYQDIKDDILTKVFQPGEKLNIKELAREYQVSDTPVKQALQRLAEEKLVVNTPNKGMSVRALTPHELQDIFEHRNAHEKARGMHRQLSVLLELPALQSYRRQVKPFRLW